MANPTYAQARALIASEPLTALAMLVSGEKPDGTKVTGSDTGALANVGDSASSVTILAANSSRLSVVIHNDSDATLYLKYGTAAATNSYTYKIAPQAHWEMPFRYTGLITGIWSSDAGGNARVTELT